MSSITDPYVAYLSFREEVKKGALHLEPCRLHPDVQMHADGAMGQHRFTYTLLDGTTAKGIFQITSSGWEKDVFYIQLGIAVGEEFRGQGVGRELHQKGLEEFLSRFPLPKGKKLGIEVVISESNFASQKLAQRFFTDPPVKITDKASGEPALRYEYVIVG